jgi:hypothetical protein
MSAKKAGEIELDDGIQFDDDATVVTNDVGIGGYKPPVHKKRNPKGEFTGSTGFAILSILAFCLFVAVIVLQVMEILHLNGTYPESVSIWPPK